jgi:hypothetical protein
MQGCHLSGSLRTSVFSLISALNQSGSDSNEWVEENGKWILGVAIGIGWRVIVKLHFFIGLSISDSPLSCE